MGILWTIWQIVNHYPIRGAIWKECNEANKCKTYGYYNGGVWTGAKAEHINYPTMSTCPSSTQICFGGGVFCLSLWYKKNQQDQESGPASGKSTLKNPLKKKKSITLEVCLVRKQVTVKSQNLTKDLVHVLITYFDTQRSGLSQVGHK